MNATIKTTYGGSSYSGNSVNIASYEATRNAIPAPIPQPRIIEEIVSVNDS